MWLVLSASDFLFIIYNVAKMFAAKGYNNIVVLNYFFSWINDYPL